MNVDPARMAYWRWKFGRPMVSSDPYDSAEWQAFEAGWTARDAEVLELGEVGRRVLYGLVTGDNRESWFLDRDRLRTLVTTPLAVDPPAPPVAYTAAQQAAYRAGWDARTAEVEPIYDLGFDVLEGLVDGRAEQADPVWISSRDHLRDRLGVR